ncbi:unnamed protein product, partial [Sphacelaria rigidula]
CFNHACGYAETLRLGIVWLQLEYGGEVWKGNAKLMKKVETVQTAASKKILGCSNTSSKCSIKSRIRSVPT